MSRATKAEQQALEKAYLAERMPHDWAGTPSRCTRCQRKYGKAAGVICPARTRPGRWKLHCRRQWLHAQYPTKVPVCNASWVYEQITELTRTAKDRRIVQKRGRQYEQSYTCPDEQAWWKYSRDARRYRAYLRLWWTLPASETSYALRGLSNGYSSRWEGLFTRGRNKLIAKVRETQRHELREGETIYTFYPDARVDGRDLFTEAQP